MKTELQAAKNWDQNWLTADEIFQGVLMVIKHEKLHFINLINRLPEREYLLSMISYGTAPTIREEKPSSLMTFTKNGKNLYNLWNTYKSEVGKELDLEFIEFNKKSNSVRVLFYKRKQLEECIYKKECRDFLNRVGYGKLMTLEACLSRLKQRFERVCPHEIGIFLGIPVEDVVGFIKYRGENSILCSYWKVYHNPDVARTLFEKYDKAREDIRRAIKDKYQYGQVDNLVVEYAVAL
ncbi:DUF3793 family protein [Petroclostridium sp. X23]|uniref:DUF3793 family protein n=1 Tax=Petroclostridium sp. X23 TaxID=3045146 RepID=UPI0024AD81AE|nr:DUF3793 family protein [Petroclostridium sp. X23]WHH58659.1 DUF3793 family protein [Petroclostridium sp. X23]